MSDDVMTGKLVDDYLKRGAPTEYAYQAARAYLKPDFAVNGEELRVLKKALTSRTFKNIFGGEEWELTEDEEGTLWTIVDELEKTP